LCSINLPCSFPARPFAFANPNTWLNSPSDYHLQAHSHLSGVSSISLPEKTCLIFLTFSTLFGFPQSTSHALNLDYLTQSTHVLQILSV
jgi:hypothetical protein